MIFNWNPALISNWCNHSLSELTFKLKVSNLFWTLGVFLAKTLQDSRLVDLPLSTPFLKLLCQVDLSSKSFKTHFLKRNFIGIENLKNYVMSNCHAKMTLGRGGRGCYKSIKKNISTFRYWYMQYASQSADYCPGFFGFIMAYFVRKNSVIYIFQIKMLQQTICTGNFNLRIFCCFYIKIHS